MKKEQSCGTCQFWEAQQVNNSENAQGICRRSPPQIFTTQQVVPQTSMGPGGRLVQLKEKVVQTQVTAMFPPMMSSDKGCGEHKEK